MKPLRIEMHAFGPFAEKEVVDFGKLGNTTFFLIHGPTGSGKSTILDAMCFALYGETSGAERQGAQMRSHHALAECETRVVLDFAVGERRYRVERAPWQLRPRQRGQGDPVEAKPRATLWRTDQGAEEVLATKVSDVTEEIVRLLGFTADQFRQVVVLPQGQFRKLLSAGSQERQEILAQLFSTEAFRRIESVLKERTRELLQALRANETQRKGLLERIGGVAEAEVPGVVAQGAQELAVLERELDELGRQAAAARQALSDGQKVRDQLAERDAARAQVVSVEAAREQVTQVREDLAAATRALEAEPALGLRNARGAAVERAAKELGSARDDEALVKAGLAVAKEALAGEEAREPERERAAKEIGRLEAMDEAVRTLREALALQEDAVREHRGRLDARDALSRALEDADRNREALEADLAASVDAAAREDGLRARRDAAVKDLQEHKELAAQVEARERAARNLEAQTDRVKGLEDALRRAAEALDLTDARWRTGQAAVLAQGLQEGQACPVCGATHHPAPATASAGEVPDDAELQTLRREREEAAAALERARVDGAALHEQHKAIAEKVAAIRLRLGDLADASPDSLEVAARNAERALAEVAKRAQARERLQKAVDDARAKRVGLQEQLQQAETALQEATGVLERNRAQVDERGARVPEEMRSEGALERALQGACEGLAALREALEGARQRLGEAERKYAAARTALDGAIRTAAATEDDLSKAQAALAQAIVQAGFADEAALVAARRTGAERDAMEGEVARFDQAFANAQGRLQRAEEAARDLAPPDLPALEARVAETASAKQEHDQRVGAGRTRLQTLRAYAKELEALQAAGADGERRYGVLGRLSEVANGSNPLNLTFERYVLAALLDDVLVAATGRLLTMSQGRYELRRVEQPEDGRRAGGLGLEVLDYHTGLARPVATLSGGEGFMASLSLALGLAEVVQAQAGGMRLDAIFVDEGFGSLDPETLENAIRTLKALQVSGRLVGIISHLPALRENIDVRLEVIAGHGGSATRFVPVDCAT